MPGKKKKGQAKAVKSAQGKKAQKHVVDKTFGLKNKNKSKKVQNYVNKVKNQAMDAGMTRDQIKDRDRDRKAALARKRAQKESAQMADLFKTVDKNTRIPHGADPKSIICAFFLKGSCKKGNKCKFSHKAEVARKGAKRDIYTDARKEDTMETWDQEKLEEVVGSKRRIKKVTETTIVCKYFLDAIEGGKYGWFWECQNGETCHYKHALPPGFVLKKDMPDEVKVDDDRVLMQQIEQERKKLDLSQCTPVTLELFLKWKEERKKLLKKQAQEKKAEEGKKNKRRTNGMSGRALFAFDSTIFVDDANADVDEYEADPQDEKAVDDTVTKEWGGIVIEASVNAVIGDAALFDDDDEELPDTDSEVDEE